MDNLHHHQLGPSDPSANQRAASGKRPVGADEPGPRKKSKQESDGYDSEEKEEAVKDGKPKQTRGSRACTVCRRLKMKCVGAEHGPPCKRCETGGHECIFEESNRGKRSTKKSEAMQRSLSKMEKTLDVVLRSLGNPALQNLAETLQRPSRSPSPHPHSQPQAGRPNASASPATAGHHQHHLTSSTANLMSPAGSPFVRTPVESSNQHAPGAATRRGESSQRPPQAPGSSSFGSRSLNHPTSPKLDSLPDSTLNPLGLLADTSLSHRREKESMGQGGPEDDRIRNILPTGQFEEEEDPRKVGLANERYFKPGPMNILPLRRKYIERHIQPEMLTFVPKEEVIELFKIFFDHMNPHCPLLDPSWHTPSLVCSRSPFLLTVICAASSKFYAARPEIHQRLNKIARKLAFSVPEQGFKSVEIVQAYLILALWGVGPVERYEMERTWIHLGLAIRVATDLNMHRKIPYVEDDDAGATAAGDAKAHKLEIRNRERTWMMCFVLDRSLSSQTGKPHSIKEDFIIRQARRWWQESEAVGSLSADMDAGLSAYVEYQRIISRALDFLYSGTNTPTGLQTDCDYLTVVKAVESQLTGWVDEWDFYNHDGHATDVVTPFKNYRRLIVQFYYHYANLLVNSFGLQNAIERAPIDLPHFFGRCYSSATAFINIVKEIAPKGYLRYAPDSHFVFLSYAVLMLLKLIRPDFRQFIGDEQKVLDIVTEMADLLEGIAVNPYHTPALSFAPCFPQRLAPADRPSLKSTSQVETPRWGATRSIPRSAARISCRCRTSIRPSTRNTFSRIAAPTTQTTTAG